MSVFNTIYNNTKARSENEENKTSSRGNLSLSGIGAKSSHFLDGSGIPEIPELKDSLAPGSI